MINDTILLHEYTEILLGMRKSFSGSLFNGNADANERTALTVFKYALDIFLRCRDPKAIETVLTKEIVEKMKLTKVLTYIHFPEELDKNKDFFYIAHLLYPRVVPYDQKDLSLKVYKEILEGKLHKFPKKYLDGFEGKMRSNYCLAYMISHFLSFEDIGDMYSYFASSNGMNSIKKYKLKQACIDIYETPVDYLHDTLSEEQKDDFWYIFYKYKTMQAKTDRKLKIQASKDKKAMEELEEDSAEE